MYEHDHDDDFSLAYQDSCGGLTLLLIHGYPLNSSIWEAQIEDLSDIARVIAPDLRGHGQSDASGGPYSMAMMAEDCVGLLESLGLQDPVVICGHSMGGYIALEIFRQYPEWVGGLILVSTRAGADSLEAKENRDRAAQTALDQGAGAIAEDMLPRMLSPQTLEEDEELVEQISEMMANTSVDGIVGALTAMKERADSTPMLGEIDVPTLIIHGADDQLIPVSEARVMRDGIPDAVLEVIPEAGHLPSLEQPGEFNTAVWNFLERVGEELESE